MPEVTECFARVSSMQEFLSAVDKVFTKICDTDQGNKCELWYRGQAKSQSKIENGIKHSCGGKNHGGGCCGGH